MNTKLIKGLSQVQAKYDAFFIDLWGVIHNGVELYPGAIDVLENLNKLNKRFVLISNAPRPSKSVKKYLLNLKMDKAFLANVFTSGEAALRSLKKNIYGKKFYHLGPERDKDLIEEFEKNKTALDKCDFILCTGLFDSEINSLDYYKNLLKKFTKLKMICTNPDLMVHRGSSTEYCAGSIALIFEKLGGKVIYFGKPYPEIYNFCVKKNENILAIGDNIRTDIKGANRMNFDALLITNGIHKDEFINLSKESYDKILIKYKAQTNYYQENLTW
jgi:HAD superfamily hydrolase (TIGR01459 family)